VRELKGRALESLSLAIELFNRPAECLRTDGVLILLHHALEMLLKAAIYEKRGRLHEPRSRETYKCLKCVAIAQSDLGIVSSSNATYLRILSGLRDHSVHYYHVLSEGMLYVQAQAGVTTFGDILRAAFGESLADYLPARVLPISTQPPADLHMLMDDQFSHVAAMLASGRRQRAKASAIVRPYMVMDSNVDAEGEQPTEAEVDRALDRLAGGAKWQDIFRGVARLNAEAEGTGLNLTIRLTKREGMPVHIVRPDDAEPGTPVVVRRVNELDVYNMGLTGVAEKVGLTMPRTLAAIRYLNLQADPECFKEFRIGSQHYRRYSQKAVAKLREEVPRLDMDQVWRAYGPGMGPRIRSLEDL
jgi:hypothetical protein